MSAGSDGHDGLLVRSDVQNRALGTTTLFEREGQQHHQPHRRHQPAIHEIPPPAAAAAAAAAPPADDYVGGRSPEHHPRFVRCAQAAPAADGGTPVGWAAGFPQAPGAGGPPQLSAANTAPSPPANSRLLAVAGGGPGAGGLPSFAARGPPGPGPGTARAQPPCPPHLLREIAAVERASQNPTAPTRCRKSKRNQVKRPLNRFFIFRLEMQTQYTALYPGSNNREISKMIAEQWKLQPPQVKAHFGWLADMAKKKHAEMYPDYKYQPSRPRRPSNANSPTAEGKASDSDQGSEAKYAGSADDGGRSIEELALRPSARFANHPLVLEAAAELPPDTRALNLPVLAAAAAAAADHPTAQPTGNGRPEFSAETAQAGLRPGGVYPDSIFGDFAAHSGIGAAQRRAGAESGSASQSVASGEGGSQPADNVSALDYVGIRQLLDSLTASMDAGELAQDGDHPPPLAAAGAGTMAQSAKDPTHGAKPQFLPWPNVNSMEIDGGRVAPAGGEGSGDPDFLMDVGGGADETDEEIRRLREQLDRLERLRQHHHVNVTAVSSPPGGLAAGRYNPTLPQATAVAGVAGGTVGSRAFLMEPAAQTHAAQSAGFARPLPISSKPQAWADPIALGDVGLPTYPPYVGTPALPIGPDGAATPGAFSGLPSKPVSRSWSAAAAASANEHWPQVKRTGGEPASPTLFGSEFHASPSHGELLPPNAASNAAGAGARSSYSFAAPGPANNAARRPEDPVAPDGGLVLSSGTGLPNYYQYWTAAEPGPMEPHVAVAPAIFGAMNGQINMRGLGAAGGAAGCGVVQGSYVGVGQTAFPVAQPRHANRQGLPAKAGSPAYPDGIMRYAQPGNEAPLADRADVGQSNRF